MVVAGKIFGRDALTLVEMIAGYQSAARHRARQSHAVVPFLCDLIPAQRPSINMNLRNLAFKMPGIAVSIHADADGIVVIMIALILAGTHIFAIQIKRQKTVRASDDNLMPLVVTDADRLGFWRAAVHAVKEQLPVILMHHPAIAQGIDTFGNEAQVGPVRSRLEP